MSWRRNVPLGVVACALATGGFVAAEQLAEGKQNPVVVQRFLLGYFDGTGHFVPTAGRGATNVDRNAIILFQFSGPINMGPNLRATLPLTLAEQANLAADQAADPDPEIGFEPGVIPRRESTDRGAFYVATGTVSEDTVSIAAPSAGGSIAQAAGQFFKMLKGRAGDRVIPDRLLFNPRYAAATFNHPEEIDYNPVGLDALTQYTVNIDGGEQPTNPLKLLLNLDGVPLATPFTTTFKTTNRYVQDYTRPTVRTTNPTDNTINVATDADIDLNFSEPMNLQTFITPRFQGDDSWTVICRYTPNPINGALQGRNILIQPRVKPQTGGNVIQLRPLQGFGKGPFQVEVVLRTGVTDLSGNSIIREIKFAFLTLFDPNADSAGFVEEAFAGNTQQDTTFTTPSGDNVLASWNGVDTRGFLTTSIQSQQFVVKGPAPTTTAGFGVNLWGATPIQFQNLYLKADMGSRPRTITGFDWQTGLWFGYAYPNCVVQMGHATDSVAQLGFPGSATSAPGPSITNFRETPVVVAPSSTYSTLTATLSGPPTPPYNAANVFIGYVSGPKFLVNFPYDGKNAVILDIAHAGSGAANAQNPERWQVDSNYSLQACTFNNSTINVVQAQRWYFTTRFTFLTPGAEARSKFYDFGREDARMLPPQITPTTFPQGTSITFLWQGAKNNAGISGTPDLNTLTPFLADLRQLSNYRFIRFQATLVNNLQTMAVPSLDTLTLPFAFK